MRRQLVIGSLVLAGACSSSDEIPGPNLELRSLPAVVTLAVGEQVAVPGRTIRFGAVPSDSRCPVDVQCIQAGSAAVEISVGPSAGDGPAYLLVLHTGELPREGTALGLRITLRNLSPEPRSTQPTRDYRAELLLEAVSREP